MGNRQFPHDREDTRIHQENKHNLLSSVLRISRCPIQHPKLSLHGDWMFYLLLRSLVIVAIVSKMVGCGLPASILLKGPR